MNRQNPAATFGLLVLGSFCLPGAECQQPKPALSQPSSPVVWNGVFGSSRDKPDTLYCLMGNGFFLAPQSDNFKHLVSAWLVKHPNARIVPVEASGPAMVNQPHSEQVYAWVVDGNENMNEYLVRQGGCPGGTMLIPDRSHYPKEATKNSHYKMLVSKEEYARVIKAVAKVEGEAQKEKLGIWKHGTNID